MTAQHGLQDLVERVGVKATYALENGDAKNSGSIEFIARVRDPSKGYNLMERARRAVARHHKVKLSAVVITGLISF